MSRMELGEQLLGLASRSWSAVRDTLFHYRDSSIGDFLGSLEKLHTEPLQPREDLWDAIRLEAARYYGDAVAAQAVEELRSCPMAPTSNHYGLDTFADSVQGTLLYSLIPWSAGPERRTVVVLGFGSVSLNNLTYPMGLRLYDPKGGDLCRVPQKLPILPNRLKDRAVAAAVPFDGSMVRRARARLRTMLGNGDVTPFCEQAAGTILDEEFGDAATLNLASYAHQATRINSSLWRRMFRNRHDAPTLVQLQIESVCGLLLGNDLQDPGSLIHRLLFAPPIRNRLIDALDGSRACWQRDRLHRRLAGLGEPHDAVGTMFFWGLSDSGKRFPLVLETGGRPAHLIGLDEDTHRVWEFTPDSLASALREGRLLPSLFTCFAVLAFARGFSCVGGYYQVEYLPVIQRAIAESLAANDRSKCDAEYVAQVPTRVHLSGLQGVARLVKGSALIPAGPVEIAGAGGLARSDLAALLKIGVREASLLALAEILHPVPPEAQLPGDWAARLALENGACCHDAIRLLC